MSCPPRLFVEEFCELHEKKMESVELKRKTDRDYVYDVEVVEVDTTRKQLKIHFVGLSHEYDEWRDNCFSPRKVRWRIEATFLHGQLYSLHHLFLLAEFILLFRR